jgi:hypothetical protein
VLRTVKEEENIVHTVKRIKANWIGHILRRNCLLKHVFEEEMVGRIYVKGRRRRRRKHLLDDLEETIGYCNLKEIAPDRTVCRIQLEEAMDLSQDRLRNE